ncbi:tetratricopeptide repeat protein [Aquimarina hainanensis]|uniref:Tetratricopeptide repeat protein n=1 Tax=Aquimarina hainanensis TaxID=1578017 RepID=A0ABW5N9I2_9FLAO
MNKYITLVLFVVVLFTTTSSAQQSAIYTNDLVLFHQAMELYNNKQFLAAQNLFDKVKSEVKDENIQADCAYYIANCAVWLNQKGADTLMEDFVEEYPTSVKRNAAYLDVASYYFDHGKYAYARKWYDKVDTKNMSRSELEKYNFNNGYAYFKIQRFNEAKKYLNKVQDSEKYGAQAKYYLGFIAYEGDNYKEANELFDEVKDLKEYNKNLSYFQSDMNFKSGDFRGAIREGIAQLPTSKAAEKSELNKIIGESYFNLEEYEKAIPYLKAYKGRKGKWSNTDYYQLGYAFYKQKSYEEAISEFNKIVDGRNAISQNAYYHLAESYLRTDKKQQALHAFKNASEMNFEQQIKEDAAYNYAKLSYEIGNSYKTTPQVLLGYLKEYPNSEYKDEINELLISSYLTSKNYKEAMDLLERSRNFEDKKVYQKVAFYRAVELFNEGDYPMAIRYFDKSLSEQRDPVFTARAMYWKTECQYVLNDFEEALLGYKEFKSNSSASQLEEFRDIDYNLAYTYFKLKKYEQAAFYFDVFLKQGNADSVKEADSYLRMADCHFISRKYWPAMEAYNMAIKKGGADADYAHYQKAISYGFVNKNDRKIEDLLAFLNNYPNSVYKDDALYSLGNVYISEQKINKGIAAYDRIISETPKSSYVAKAMLKQGLVYYNENQGDNALSKFKKVVAKYPGTEEAVQAVNTARLIYVDMGRTDEYASWVKGLGFVNVSDEDLDNTVFEAAEKQFLENNESAAIHGFEKYLAQFPKGLHATKSHYHLAELLFKKKEKEATIPHYLYVLNQPRGEFTEQSLARLSQVYLEDRKYEEAIPVLERLENTGDYPQNIIFAQSNLMKSYYQLVNYRKTILYAEKVLSNPKIEKDVKNDAHLFIARAALQTADVSRARAAYKEVEKSATGELAAEALYYNAYFIHESGEYKASNEVIQKLAKEYSGYRLYGAKGLVLMAKNFYALKDAYQATYILESVITNFSELQDVVAEAKTTLQKIKAEESKTNSSIQTDQ